MAAAKPDLDEQVAAARAQLALLRSSLGPLKAQQASLEKVAKNAANAEATLKGELAAAMRQGAELQREDVEHLIYTDEGWGPWEDDFRGLWEPACPRPSLEERPPILGARRDAHRPVDAESLLGDERGAHAAEGGAAVISWRPLMVMIPDFASAEECAGLIELGFRTCKPHNKWAQEAQRPGQQRANGAAGPVRGVATASLRAEELQNQEDRKLLESMQRRVAALTGVPEHGKEIKPFLKFDQPGEGRRDQKAEEDDLSIGVHLDINGGFKHCVCSVIVYLNACDGGRTVFPCANDAESGDLGSRLSAAGHTHTSHQRVHEGGLGDCAAALVQRAEAAPGSLRISPRRGMAVLFFSLLDKAGDGASDGPPAPDAWSWHGGAAVRGKLGKWTLQIFKEVPAEFRDGNREVEYVAALRTRIEKAAFTAMHGKTDLSAMD